MSQATDLQRGYWRRIYGAFITGKRICKIPLEAEAIFWRINAIVDDCGNYHADPVLLCQAIAGRRADITPDRIRAWLDFLVGEQLIELYQACDETYLHIRMFEEIQPAGKNGKRIQRYPLPPHQPTASNPGPDPSPTPAERDVQNPMASSDPGTDPSVVKTKREAKREDRQIRVNPNESSANRKILSSHTHTHTQSHTQTQPPDPPDPGTDPSVVAVFEGGRRAGGSVPDSGSEEDGLGGDDTDRMIRTCWNEIPFAGVWNPKAASDCRKIVDARGWAYLKQNLAKIGEDRTARNPLGILRHRIENETARLASRGRGRPAVASRRGFTVEDQ